MNLIEILNIKGQDTITLGNSCSSCSGGCEPVTHNIVETIDEFNDKYSDVGAIVRYEMDDSNMEEVAQRLQELYTNSGERLIITASNVKFILGKLNPIIAINGRLAANNYVPGADELKLAAENDSGIYSSICQ